jgi:type I restriction enzyme M protein
MANSKKKTETPKSTAQQLASLIKSCREIMRKDKGLNGDLDRLPMLTWIMFLKFLDDMERMREEEAKLAGKKFRPAIEPPYRWRDWAAVTDGGTTGPELLAFISQDEAICPDGKRGAGLFAYLRSLQSTNGDRRDIIAKVFEGTVNRMLSGYLLRDVINKINEIHFTSKDEIHTLGQLYESMLREMRDAAGDSGEFYTPRPVVKFIVSVIDPRLGQTVLDPAAGTGGFLVEAFEHLKKQCKKTEDFNRLQQESLYGIEPKTLPYLLCQMNLLLHGLEYPRIDPGNALRFPLREIGDKDRVDIIITNPPFGGAEERGILSNFPEDMQTSETALLFLQLIMRKIRRNLGNKYGQAAVVMPDGILTQEGIAARVREQLVTQCNLHTVVRLPKGVFEPYTKSSTSILFFDSRVASDSVWFYEVPIRSDIKTYTQTQSFQFAEMAPCIQWWKDRVENQNAWKVPVAEIKKHDFGLNFRNPKTDSAYRFPSPNTTGEAISTKLSTLLSFTKQLTNSWNTIEESVKKAKWPVEPFSHLAEQVEREVIVEPDCEYPILAMSWYAKGLYIKYRKKGAEIQAPKLYRVEQGDFVYNRLFAWKGSFAEASSVNNECYVSNEFPCFRLRTDKVVPGYLWAYFSQPAIWEFIESLSTGTTSTSRLRLKEAKLSQFKIPIPPLAIQQQLADAWQTVLQVEQEVANLGTDLGRMVPGILERSVPLQK